MQGRRWRFSPLLIALGLAPAAAAGCAHLAHRDRCARDSDRRRCLPFRRPPDDSVPPPSENGAGLTDAGRTIGDSVSALQGRAGCAVCRRIDAARDRARCAAARLRSTGTSWPGRLPEGRQARAERRHRRRRRPCPAGRAWRRCAATASARCLPKIRHRDSRGQPLSATDAADRRKARCCLPAPIGLGDSDGAPRDAVAVLAQQKLDAADEAAIIGEFGSLIAQADHRDAHGAHALCRPHGLGEARGVACRREAALRRMGGGVARATRRPRPLLDAVPERPARRRLPVCQGAHPALRRPDSSRRLRRPCEGAEGRRRAGRSRRLVGRAARAVARTASTKAT